ncbi:hypothetical protein [Carnobacterium inhibens]|uniref:hypothetical protein n=1 Tax=Carnobacterium inhibens TaxID=147709 RepID=UPI00203D81A4|nr:hypothetical protein [Carnobacterium inhibens]MCM3511678.1 hypothetical protein [Carnobacterium inhibens]
MNFIFGVAFFLGAAAFILFAIVTVFKKIKGKDVKGPLKNTMISFVVAVIGVIGIGVTQEDIPEADDNSNTQSESTSEPDVEESELSKEQQGVLDNVNDFPAFLDSYKELAASERTPLWDKNIYGTNVTWTGIIFEIGEQQIYIVEPSKYKDNMTWNSASATPDAYSVFVADFESEINDDEFSVGSEVTVTGDLESRGDPDNNSHWKLYNAELN